MPLQWLTYGDFGSHTKLIVYEPFLSACDVHLDGTSRRHHVGAETALPATTASIARRAPVQNERGPASSTLRLPHARAQSASAGAARRNARQALRPPASVASGRWISRAGVSSTTRSTANGLPAAAGASHADSMSTARAPSPASTPRCAPRTRWSTEATGPTRTRSMPRAASAATIGPLAQGVTPSGPRTSLATTTSPARKPPATAPQNPATATAVGRDASGELRRGPSPGGAHAGAQHQRFGKTAPHGRALDAKRSDDKQAGVVGVHVSHGHTPPGSHPGPRARPRALFRSSRTALSMQVATVEVRPDPQLSASASATPLSA